MFDVQVLLAGGAKVDHADRDGWTALRAAAWGGHKQVVDMLLEAGAAVDCADTDQRTALRAAAWGGHEDIVLALLRAGAHVNRTDDEGRTALIAAAYMGHSEIVEHLLEYGAEIDHADNDGRTALSVAALCVPANEGYAKVSVSTRHVLPSLPYMVHVFGYQHMLLDHLHFPLVFLYGLWTALSAYCWEICVFTLLF